MQAQLITTLVLLQSVQQVAVQHDGSQDHRPLPPPTRLVFSLTSTKVRLAHIKPVIDRLVEGQTRPADAVFLAVPPDAGTLPAWLTSYDANSRRPGVLRVLRMEADYGPASKLLAVLREGGERLASTVVVFGDDDVMYGERILQLHHDAQASATVPTAYGSRRIGIGSGERREELLEATGSISLRASFLPDAAFGVRSTHDACRLSDDYWISHHLSSVGVRLGLLAECTYDFNSNLWPTSCGAMAAVAHIERIEALSARALAADGRVLGGGGDWRDQLKRYEVCQELLRQGRANHGGDSSSTLRANEQQQQQQRGNARRKRRQRSGSVEEL